MLDAVRLLRRELEGVDLIAGNVATFEGACDLVKLDVDDNPDTAARYAIRSIPSLLFFQNGTLKDQLVGNMPQLRKEVSSRLERLLASTAA